MRSSYIELKLTDKNEFRAEVAFEINGMVFSKVNVKMAQDCADNSIAKSISFGVNDTRQKKEEDKRRFRVDVREVPC